MPHSFRLDLTPSSTTARLRAILLSDVVSGPLLPGPPRSCDASGAKAIIAGHVDIAQKLVNTVPDLISAMRVRAVAEQNSTTAPKSWVNLYELFKSVKDAEDWDDERPHGSPVDSSVQSEDDESALIVFTSGTTSLAKGGIHTNASVGCSLLSQAMALKLTPSHRTCCHMPNHYIGGINIALLSILQRRSERKLCLILVLPFHFKPKIKMHFHRALHELALRPRNPSSNRSAPQRILYRYILPTER
ncbi:hypothetical protein BST61_g9722 [Cercospora zeina]